MSELNCSVSALYLHPIKSCGAIAVGESLMIETGLEFDRAWMVVDPAGDMLTQRELPRLALISGSFKGDDLVLRAPGMLALHIALGRVEAPTRVRVWDDEVKAFEMGPLAAQWFSDFLGRPARLVRFDPGQRRLSSREWTADVEAENAFADGFPLLLLSSASLADLNSRLTAKGVAPVTMQRFRPNLVLDGLQAFEEDFVDEVHITTAEGLVRLKLVKPCVRCTIPDVDPATGQAGHEPGDTLSGFRANARMGGGITFGMNAVLLEGTDRMLKVGQTARAFIKF
ncbi:MAG: MOSC N-terminal beta barrel domain-containing protein [Rubrivivax sp.]|nr:MOSC N-terminal beta barrel domain-containing protein [Rubrivivax sp.]MDP3085124.1 MOSC N-terminal beta barrel domain-containing protein [Rubrivivax sp.]